MCGKTAHYAVVLPSATQRGFVTMVKIPSSRWFRGIGRRLVPADNLHILFSAGAGSGCGFSLSNPREGRQLPSVRDANGGIKNLLSQNFLKTHFRQE